MTDRSIGGIQGYLQLPPCIDMYGHKFAISDGHAVCERCGLIRGGGDD